jgi:hypothetical protein
MSAAVGYSWISSDHFVGQKAELVPPPAVTGGVAAC